MKVFHQGKETQQVSSPPHWMSCTLQRSMHQKRRAFSPNAHEFGNVCPECKLLIKHRFENSVSAWPAKTVFCENGALLVWTNGGFSKRSRRGSINLYLSRAQITVVAFLSEVLSTKMHKCGRGRRVFIDNKRRI